MAVEARRGCGFRTVGSTYLVCDDALFPCDRLTYEIPEVCPCCGGGTKFSRGWTWVDPVKFFGGDHVHLSSFLTTSNPDSIVYTPGLPMETLCDCAGGHCPVCRPDLMGKRAALLWVGEKHYTPEEFKREAATLGISKKISGIPRDLELGKTWVLCAHLKAITRENPIVEEMDLESGATGEKQALFETEYFPGVFFAFQPTRIEKIVKQSHLDLFQRIQFLSEEARELWLAGNPYPEESRLTRALRTLAGESRDHDKQVKIYRQMKRDADRGITFVPVPDSDPDHNPEGK